MGSALVTETYAGYPNGAPAGHTHIGSGASSVLSGQLLTTGLSALQRGGATLDASAGGLIQRVRAHSKLVGVGSGGVPAGGVASKYSPSGGALTFLGFRASCVYERAAVAVNSFITMTVEVSRAGASASTFSNFNTGVFLTTGDEVVIEMLYTPGVGLANGTLQYRAYRQGASVPAYASLAVHSDFAAIAGPGGLIDFADAGGSNTGWVSLETENAVPDAPTVTVTGIGHFVATLTGSAFADPNAGGTHAATRFRVRDTSDDSIAYGPTLMASASLGPHQATGLPADTSGLVGEIQYQDQYGLWGEWGTSTTFATLGPPATPAVTLDQVRRTTARMAGSAYDDGGSGVAHAATQYRVRRLSDDAVLAGPGTAPGGELEGPWYATGLPEGPAGAGGRPIEDPDFAAEIRYQDADGLWSGWGTLTFQTLNLWDSGEFVVHLDVLIERSDGAGGTLMQSYRDFGGRNWIKTLRLQPASVDTPIGAGTLTLHRQVGADSLAPLVTASALNQDGVGFAPALDFGREIEIRICILAGGAEPEEDDWDDSFHWRGITDDPEWPEQGGDVTVPFRDYSGKLADTMIRTETRYGDADDPVPAIDVFQAIVDDHMGTGQYTITDLTTGAGFEVRSYTISDVFVWEALQTLALQWGGKSLRQVDGPTSSTLAVIETDRAKVDPDYTIRPTTYIEVHETSTAGKDVRTIVRGRAVHYLTHEILTSQLPAEEDVDTDPLVDLYGPLFLEFDEDQASTIDTQDELDAMVGSAYADVSTPPFPIGMETKFCPFAAVDDLVRWGANALVWDQALDAALLEVSHSFDGPGQGRTTWKCAGAPKGHWKEWTRRGVDVAGIGTRPSIFDLVLTPAGATLTAEIDANNQVEHGAIWSRLGASALVAGIPDDTYLVAGDLRPPDLSASWAVRDGTYYVLARGVASDGRFVQREEAVVITGIGGGPLDPPVDIPATPILELGALVGDQELNLSWFNTNDVSAVRVEIFSGGVSVVTDELVVGSDSYTTSVPATGGRAKARVQYTNGPGLDGPWSAFSVDVRLGGP